MTRCYLWCYKEFLLNLCFRFPAHCFALRLAEAKETYFPKGLIMNKTQLQIWVCPDTQLKGITIWLRSSPSTQFPQDLWPWGKVLLVLYPHHTPAVLFVKNELQQLSKIFSALRLLLSALRCLKVLVQISILLANHINLSLRLWCVYIDNHPFLGGNVSNLN